MKKAGTRRASHSDWVSILSVKAAAGMVTSTLYNLTAEQERKSRLAE